MKFRILGAAALSFAMATQAHTADAALTQDMASASEAFDWGGFYLGAHGGYVWTSGRFGGITERFNGGLVGAHAGYNIQHGSFVFGGEIDLSHMWNDKSYSGGALEVGTSWQGSLRARLGYAMDRTLIYGTGGVARTNFYQYFPSVDVQLNEGLTGWTVGAGIEHAFTDNWIARTEYRYSDFGNMHSLGPSIPIIEHAVRAGISYKF